MDWQSEQEKTDRKSLTERGKTKVKNDSSSSSSPSTTNTTTSTTTTTVTDKKV